MSEIKLVPAVIDEAGIDELADFAGAIWREYWTDILKPGQTEYMIEKFQSSKAIKNQIENERYSYFYIMCDGVRAGYTGMSVKQDYLFLSKLYILKNFRHKGIASAAFPLITDFAVANRRSRIILTVNKYNSHAISSYKKFGFKEIDAVVTDIGSGYVMDDYIMEYTVE